MPKKPVDKAPVKQVGGPQNKGPWPAEVEEIARGAAYNRPVELSDGSVQDVEVTITDLQQILDQQGNPTTGYSVSYQFNDPTSGGGGQ